MKTRFIFLKIVTLVFSSSLAFGANKEKCRDLLAGLTAKQRAEVKAFFAKMDEEIYEQRQRDGAKEKAHFDKQARVQTELDAVRTFRDWTQVSQDAKEYFLLGHNEMENFRHRFLAHPGDFIPINSLRKPMRIVYAQKMLKFMKKYNGFRIPIGMVNAYPSSKLIIGVQIYEDSKGRILGGVFYVQQNISYRDVRYDGTPSGIHNVTSLAAMATFDEKGRAIKYDPEMREGSVTSEF